MAIITRRTGKPIFAKAEDRKLVVDTIAMLKGIAAGDIAKVDVMEKFALAIEASRRHHHQANDRLNDEGAERIVDTTEANKAWVPPYVPSTPVWTVSPDWYKTGSSSRGTYWFRAPTFIDMVRLRGGGHEWNNHISTGRFWRNDPNEKPDDKGFVQWCYGQWTTEQRNVNYLAYRYLV